MTVSIISDYLDIWLLAFGCLGLLLGILIDFFVIKKNSKLNKYRLLLYFVLILLLSSLPGLNNWFFNQSNQDIGIAKLSLQDNEIKHAQKKPFIPETLKESDLIIANVSLFSDIKTITSILGKNPIKIEKGRFGTLYYFDEDLQITISRVSGQTSGIHLLSKRYSTKRELAVGDSLSKVYSKYGFPNDRFDDISDEENCSAYDYYFTAPDYFAILRFYIDSKTNTIRITGVTASKRIAN